MLDIGWQEFLLVAFVLLIVIGPKDLPKVLKSIMSFVRKIKSMAYEFQNTVDEMAEETELNDLRKNVSSIKDSKLLKDSKAEINVLNKINDKTKLDLEDDINKIKKS